VLVYLDSQDYSRLTDPRFVGDANNTVLLTTLQRSAADGLHRFPFSNLHVQEAVHFEASSRALALGRARLMTKLSCGSVFAPLEHILMMEVANALKASGFVVDESLLNLTIVRDDSVWWPWELLADEGPLNLRAEITAQLDQDVSLLNRQLRRRYQKQRGSVEKQFSIHVDAELPNILRWISENFPPSAKITDHQFLRRFLLGQVDQAVFFNEIMGTALELENFIGWAIDRFDHMRGRGAAAYIKTSGYELTEKIGLALSSSPSQESSKFPAEIQVRLDVMRTDGINSLATSIKRSMINAGAILLVDAGVVAKGVNPEHIVGLLANYGGDEMPGIEVVSGCFRVWLKLITAPASQRQKILRSDVLDMLHAIYLPYVDLFHADARFGNILRQTKTAHLQKVECVPKYLVERLA
jgi:hypothetical protein